MRPSFEIKNNVFMFVLLGLLLQSSFAFLLKPAFWFQAPLEHCSVQKVRKEALRTNFCVTGPDLEIIANTSIVWCMFYGAIIMAHVAAQWACPAQIAVPVRAKPPFCIDCHAAPAQCDKHMGTAENDSRDMHPASVLVLSFIHRQQFASSLPQSRSTAPRERKAVKESIGCPVPHSARHRTERTGFCLLALSAKDGRRGQVDLNRRRPCSHF
jgi:hypothetical protein